MKSGLYPDWPTYRASRPERPTRYSSARADVSCAVLAALGQTPSPCAFSAPLCAPATPGACSSPNAFARVPSGSWTIVPRICGTGPRGPLTDVRTLPGSPKVHPPAWGLTDCYGRVPYAAVPVLSGPWGPARSVRRSSASLLLARILSLVVWLPGGCPDPFRTAVVMPVSRWPTTALRLPSKTHVWWAA